MSDVGLFGSMLPIIYFLVVTPKKFIFERQTDELLQELDYFALIL